MAGAGVMIMLASPQILVWLPDQKSAQIPALKWTQFRWVFLVLDWV
jgi:hypothetical protein